MKTIATVAIQHNENPDLYLYGRRRDNFRWTIPGGHCEKEETPLQGAVREALEEVGIHLTPDQLTHVDSVQINIDTPRHCDVHLFKAVAPPGVVLDISNDPDSEFQELRYLDPRTIAEQDRHVAADRDLLLRHINQQDAELGVNELNKAIHTPSKFTNYKQLEQIKRDHNVGAKGKEYDEQSLNESIIDRKVADAERMVREADKMQRRPMKKKDLIPGGLAAGTTNADFPKKKIKQGEKVELEHTSSKKIADEISRDHLTEDPAYYKKLKTIETKKAETETSHPGPLKDKEFKRHDKAVEAAGNRHDKMKTAESQKTLEAAIAAREDHLNKNPKTKEHINKLNAYMKEKYGVGQVKKSEPLMKPYRSDAQRRWAHTMKGKAALGGKAKVAHWDKESKGLDLPDKILRKSPAISEEHGDINWPKHPAEEGKHVKSVVHNKTGTKVHVVHLHDRDEEAPDLHTGSVYYTTKNNHPLGEVTSKTQVNHLNHETGDDYDPHFSYALTEPEFRGKGLNKLTHLAALKDYKSLKSDYRLSPNSQKTYESLSRNPSVKSRLMPTDKPIQINGSTAFPQDTQHELKWKQPKKLAASELQKDQPKLSLPKVNGITTRPDEELHIVPTATDRKTLTIPNRKEIKSKLAIKTRARLAAMLHNKRVQYGKNNHNLDTEAATGKANNTTPKTKTLVDRVKNGRNLGLVTSPVWLGQNLDHQLQTGLVREGENNTKQHEGTHFLLNSIETKYGPKARTKIIDHVLSHFHPDDLKQIARHIQKRGYKPRSEHFKEEMVTAARDLLVKPERRQDLSRHGATPDLNRMKAAWKNGVSSLKDKDEEWLKAPTDEIERQSVRNQALKLTPQDPTKVKQNPAEKLGWKKLAASELQKSTYNSWRANADPDIENEYNWEYKNHWGHTNYFPTIEHFKNAVKNAEIKEITPEMDQNIGNRSNTQSIDELKDLTSQYQFPRDVDRITNGFKNNEPIPHPIVIKKDGRHTVMSGNTRMDAAFLSGINPKVAVIDLDKKTKPVNILGKTELQKGAARRLYGKFDPRKELDGDTSMGNWVSGNNGEDPNGRIRAKIPNPSPSARLRLTNKLANRTTSRLNPETKQREFLLHRQMSTWEFDKTAKNGRINHDNNEHTSWTPNIQNITNGKGIYPRESFDPEDKESYSHVVSAWVPESHIKNMPAQYGEAGTYDPDKRGTPTHTALKEQEVIVKPGHNSQIHEVIKDTGESPKEWNWQPKKLAASELQKSSMAHLVTQPHAILSVENGLHPQPGQQPMTHEAAMSHIQSLGTGKVHSIDGHYGSPERSIFVSHPTPEQLQGVRDLAHSTGQESHIESTGQHHKMYFSHGPDAGKIVTGTGTNFHSVKPHDYYSTLGDATFTHNFDFGKSELQKNSKLVHFGRVAGLKQLDPNYQGTGAKGAENKHGVPDVKSTYFYREGSAYEPDVMQGAAAKYGITADESKLYDLAKDPAKIIFNLRAASLNRQVNPGSVTRDEILGAIKAAGYHGYHNSSSPLAHAVGMFHPTTPESEEVLKSEQLDKGQNGDWQKEGYKLKINPSATYHRSPAIHVQAIHPIHGVVGESFIGHAKDGSHIFPHDTNVSKAHQRKGIANAMYNLAEKHTGLELQPLESDQSDDAVKLWDHRLQRSELKKSPILAEQDPDFAEYKLENHAFNPAKHKTIKEMPAGNGPNGDPMTHHIYKDAVGNINHSLHLGNPSKPISVIHGHMADDKDPKAGFVAMNTATADHHQGQGLGTKLKELALKHHGVMQSDTSVSTPEDETWNKLAQVPGVTVNRGRNQYDIAADDDIMHFDSLPESDREELEMDAAAEPHLARYKKPKKLAASEKSNRNLSTMLTKSTLPWSKAPSGASFNHPEHGSVGIVKGANDFKVVHNGKVVGSHNTKQGVMQHAATYMRSLANNTQKVVKPKGTV